LAEDADGRLLVVDARALRTVECSEFADVMWRLARETLLTPALLAIEAADRLVDGDTDEVEHRLATLLEAVRGCCRLIVLSGERPWPRRDLVAEDALLEVAFPLPDEPTRELRWRRELDGLEIADGIDLDVLVSTFRFTGEQIRAAAADARLRAAWRCPEAPVVTAADLSAACRALSNQRLAGMAQKLESRDRWTDLVLPAEPTAQLRQIANHVRHKALVFGEWGFAQKLPRGRGLTALFAGPSGTGKTMAAGVIANELALDLYRIDLSQVVSKYIGETEKNLDRIFHEAETSNAILFFDEADALFGKRSDIKDAHDRYANIETSYLLQKMEEYEGLAILATNLRANLDEAFARRLRFAVEFPMPDEEHRARIWASVFPPQAPLADDVDPARLARMLKVSGGNIANIALAASFFAAEEQTAITGPLILRAARREFQKIGRVWDDGAVRGR
jgi:SpoVK/Ycf46/Vps4 family AAA+-type ATPase